MNAKGYSPKQGNHITKSGEAATKRVDLVPKPAKPSANEVAADVRRLYTNDYFQRDLGPVTSVVAEEGIL